MERHSLLDQFIDVSGYQEGPPVDKAAMVTSQIWRNDLMMRANPDEIIMIGDTVDDGVAATAVGAKFIASGFGLTHSIRLKNELDLKKVDCTYLAETPRDLCQFLENF